MSVLTVFIIAVQMVLFRFKNSKMLKLLFLQQILLHFCGADDSESTTLNPDYIYDDYNNETSATSKYEFIEKCKNLSSLMGAENFFWCLKKESCCETPVLSIDESIREECIDECKKVGGSYEEVDCCIRVCVLAKVNFLLFSTDPNFKPRINPKGLMEIYAKSVDNDPEWEPILKSSTQRCSDDVGDLVYGYACDVIPDNLSIINFCCYKENFLRCPHVNPKNREKCAICREILVECIADTDDGFFGVIRI